MSIPKRKNDNAGFDLLAIKWARDEVRGIPRDARFLLNTLASRCSPDHKCFSQQRTLAADMECSRTYVIKLLNLLESKKLITKKRRRSTSCEYRLIVPADYSLKSKRASESHDSDFPEVPKVTSTATFQSHEYSDFPKSQGNDHKKPLLSSHNEVTKRIEISVEKSGEASDDATHGEKHKGKKKGIGKGEEGNGEKNTETKVVGKVVAGGNQVRSDALAIVAKYYKPYPTRKAMVAFWFALMRRFHPDYRMLEWKLTPAQYKHVHGLFESYGNLAFYVIAAAVAEWDTASVFAAKIEGLKPYKSDAFKSGDIPKCGPTPTFVSRAGSGFGHYLYEAWGLHGPNDVVPDKTVEHLGPREGAADVFQISEEV